MLSSRVRWERARVAHGEPDETQPLSPPPAPCCRSTRCTTGYDRDGNVLSYTDSVMGTWSFGYDSLNRLTSAVVSSGYYGGTGSAPYTGTNLAGTTLAWS